MRIDQLVKKLESGKYSEKKTRKLIEKYKNEIRHYQTNRFGSGALSIRRGNTLQSVHLDYERVAYGIPVPIKRLDRIRAEQLKAEKLARKKELRKLRRERKLRKKREIKLRKRRGYRYVRCGQSDCNRKVLTASKNVIKYGLQACPKCFLKIFYGLKLDTYPYDDPKRRAFAQRYYRAAKAGQKIAKRREKEARKLKALRQQQRQEALKRKWEQKQKEWLKQQKRLKKAKQERHPPLAPLSNE